MIDHHTATLRNVLQETAVGLLRPSIAVVIQHDQRIGFEVEHKAGHILASSGRDRQIYRETARVLQNLFQHDMAHRPIVVVLPCDQQGLDRGLCHQANYAQTSPYHQYPFSHSTYFY